MRLDLVFLFYVFRSLGILLSVLFPILYLADFAFVKNLLPLDALVKMPWRYGQSLASLVLWSVWLAVRSMRDRYSDTAFTSIGFRPKDAWRIILFLSFLFMVLDAFIIIPSNDIFFPQKLIDSKWSIKQIYNMDEKTQTINSNIAFVHKSNLDIEIWKIDEQVSFLKGKLLEKNTQIKGNSNKNKYKVEIDKDSFLVLWNDPRKLSWQGLSACKKYMKYNEIDASDIVVQLHILLSRIALILPMIIVGFGLGWKKGMNVMLICSVASNWLNQMVIFFPPPIAIFCVWFNFILWLVIGCYFFLF